MWLADKLTLFGCRAASQVSNQPEKSASPIKSLHEASDNLSGKPHSLSIKRITDLFQISSSIL